MPRTRTRKRGPRLAAALGLPVAALLTLSAAAPPRQAEIPEGWLEGNSATRSARFAGVGVEPPPPLSLTGWIHSDPMTLADLKGKVVVLDFWATWCGPCIASIPKANALQEKYGDDGLIFLGVCHSRGAEKMAETAERHGIEYPIAADVDGETVAAYAVDSFPDYYVIDRSGRLRILDCANAHLEDAIKLLLAEEPIAE